mgnify:CR=1 FL=1
MSLEVKFETPPGNVLSGRNFSPGQSLRIGGHVTGALGLGEPFTHIRLEITDGSFLPILLETQTNLLGDFWFDIFLPNANSKANVKLTATFTVTGQDVVIIPIAIGQEAASGGGYLDIYPDDVLATADQMPALQMLGKATPWVLLAVGAILLLSYSGAGSKIPALVRGKA